MPPKGGEAQAYNPEEDLVRIYLNGIGEVPLLDALEERELAERIQAGLQAVVRYADIMADPGRRRVSAEVRELQHTIADGEAAKDHMTRANLRLVVSVAKRYQSSGVPFLDLIQEGNLGLMHATEKFDPRKGFKFSTYAMWWIRQAITRGIDNTDSVIRTPVHSSDAIKLVRRTEEWLFGELGRTPTEEEIADECGFTPERLRRIRSDQLTREPLSFAHEAGVEGHATLEDFIPDDHSAEGYESVDARIFDEQVVKSAMAHLSERQRQVIRVRYGLDDGIPRTLEEVGQFFGVSRERVRKIEGGAIEELRRVLRISLAHDPELTVPRRRATSSRRRNPTGGGHSR